MNQQTPTPAPKKGPSHARDLIKKVSRSVFLTSKKEAELARAIRAEARKALSKWYFSLILLSPALFLAVVSPGVIDHYPFLNRLFGSLAYASVVFAFNYYITSIIGAKLAKYGSAHLYSLMLGLFISNILFVPAIIPFFRPDIVQHYGYIYVYLTAVLVTSMLCWAVGFVILSLLEGRFQEIFQKDGYDIDVMPKFANRHDDALQAQLPFSVRGPIRAVSAQDKYVEVITENGKHVLPMSLTSAIEQIEPISGMRVHRSVWLSWNAMDRIIYENGNPRVVCTCGGVWPVSRKFVKQLKSRLEKKAGLAR